MDGTKDYFPEKPWACKCGCGYLIGFIDDYSRYITSLGLYRSQTAEHVLETYRRAVAGYGVPKEMLTGNGRQYTNWRGEDPLRAGAGERPRQTYPVPAAPPDDAGQDRAVLEVDPGGILAAGAV